MLNWVAYWIGSYLFGQGGPLQNSANKSVPVSDNVVASAKLPVFWGNAVLQGSHIGFFIAIAALVAFWFTLNRTTTGYEVRAVGFNPEAARYGGISVARNYILAMAISGSFAGLAGCMDMLGYQYRFGVLDVQTSQLGFIGIAVALLGRNKAVGVALSALLFAALLYGTSTRSIDQSVLRPELAGNLTLMIQALVLLFVGADVLILALWQARRTRAARPAEAAAPCRGGPLMAVEGGANPRQRGITPRQVATLGILLGCFAFLLALPPITARAPWWPALAGIPAIAAGVWALSRGVKRPGWFAVSAGILGIGLGVLSTRTSSPTWITSRRGRRSSPPCSPSRRR